MDDLSNKKMYKVEIICRPQQFEELKEALGELGIDGMTVSDAIGYGTQKGYVSHYRGVEREIRFNQKTKIEIVVCKVPVETVLQTVEDVLKTGEVGDGKVFVTEVCHALRVRTGERDQQAIRSADEDD